MVKYMFNAPGNRTLPNNFEIRTTRLIIDSSTFGAVAAGNLTINGNVLLNQGSAGVRDIICLSNLTINGNVTIAGTNFMTLTAGLLTLNGPSNYMAYNGFVEAGTLVINGTVNGGAAWTVDNGATLTGSGSINGFVAVENGGTVLLGNTNGTGTMTVAGFDSAPGGSLVFGLGATNSATNGYLIDNGPLTLNGQITIQPLTGFAAGNVYTNIYYSGHLNTVGLSVYVAQPGVTVVANTSTPHYIVFQVLNGTLFPAAGQDVPMDLAAPLALSWLQNLTVVAYNVYLGTNSSAVAGATTNTAGIYLGQSTGQTLNVPGLQPNTTYYWRVDGVATNGAVTTGTVYSFTTGAAMVDVMADTWVATDALQRSLPGNADCGSPRTNRPIILFYLLWEGIGKLRCGPELGRRCVSGRQSLAEPTGSMDEQSPTPLYAGHRLVLGPTGCGLL